MKTLRIGELDARVAGGTDREGGGDGPVVVLLHGFGAPGDDLVGLWRGIAVPREVRFVFPEAPILLGREYGPGRAWWRIDMMQRQLRMMAGDVASLTGEVPEGLEEARTKLKSLVDALPSALSAPRDKIVLGGFSQGSMLSLDLALRDDAPIAGLVLLSTTLIAEAEWRPLFARRSGLAVLQSHGTEDAILPFDVAEALHRDLVAAGLDVEFLRFRGGHGVPPQVLDRMGPFLRKAFGEGAA